MQRKTLNNLPNEQKNGDNKITNLTKESQKIGSSPEGFTTCKRINCLKTVLLHTALMCLLYIKYMCSVALKFKNIYS